MHPVIRIGIFFVIAVLLARAHPMQMGWVLCVIGMAFLLQSGQGVLSAVKLLWRIRWLILSILLIYVWLPIGSMEASVSLAMQRVGLLVMMLLALQALVLNMQRSDIVMALYFLLKPVTLVGLAREKIVLRLLLTMENISELSNVIGQSSLSTSTERSRFKKFVERIVTAFEKVVLHSESTTHETMIIDTDIVVPVWQWSIPVIVIVVFITLPLIG